MAKTSQRKVIVVGSGIGGLSTGILLGDIGYDVTILERNPVPGGLLRSYARNGIECPVGVHYLGSLGEGEILRRFFDFFGVTSEIPVEKMGKDGIVDRYVFDSDVTPKGVFDMPEGLDAYRANLESAFPSERKEIAAFMELLNDSANRLQNLSFLNQNQTVFSILGQLEPLEKILDEIGCSPALKCVIGVPACWIGVAPSVCPVFFHNMSLASYLASSWRLKTNGRKMAEIFCRRFERNGGKIVVGAETSKIIVESKKVLGVALKSGEEIRADFVVAAIHPQKLLAMLPEESVKPSYRRLINRLDNTEGIFSVHATLDSAVHPEIPHNIFKVSADSDGRVLDLKYYQLRTTEHPGKTLLTIMSSGKDEVWKPWEYTKTGLRGDSYKDRKMQEASMRIEEAEKLLGTFHGLEILDAYTPLTIRDYVNSPDGSAYGVRKSAKQLLDASLINRTSLQGLYLAGQNVSAPGILGTIVGSFATVNLLVGPDKFREATPLLQRCLKRQ